MARIDDNFPALPGEEEPAGRAAYRVRCLGCTARFYTNGASLHSIKACPVCQATPFQYENVV
jgi:hypothetical protein